MKEDYAEIKTDFINMMGESSCFREKNNKKKPQYDLTMHYLGWGGSVWPRADEKDSNLTNVFHTYYSPVPVLRTS